MGQIPATNLTVELFKQMELRRDGKIVHMPKGHHPPMKDTISLPSRGYTIFRFKADNPGFWLLHCHFEYHMAVGMGLVVQVGEPEDFVKAPKNFPKCGNFVPDIDESVVKYKNMLG